MARFNTSIPHSAAPPPHFAAASSDIDVAEVALNAASEIHRFRRNPKAREAELGSVRTLVHYLEDNVPSEGHDFWARAQNSANTTVLFLVQSAVENSFPQHRHQGLQDSVTKAARLTGEMKNLVEKKKSTPATLKKIRLFCLDFAEVVIHERNQLSSSFDHSFHYR
jgi:hypothetical protein